MQTANPFQIILDELGEVKDLLYSLKKEPEIELNPNSAIEKKEYFSVLISNCVAVEKNKR